MENYYEQDNGMLQEKLRSVFKKTYLYMCIALIISGVCAYFVALSGNIMTLIEVRIPLVILEFVLIFAGSAAVKRRNVGLAGFLFLLYSIINGITLSVIFYVYDVKTIFSVFFVTAVSFAAMVLYGTLTKKNLSALGTVGMMGLVGIIIMTLLNIFVIKSTGLDFLISIVGLALFIGITLYDAQKIKRLAMSTNLSVNEIALIGAFDLYLDFINIFIRILSIFGGGSSRSRR